MKVVAYVITLILLFSHLGDSTIRAAEVRCSSYYADVVESRVVSSDRCYVGLIQGRLEEGDYSKVLSLYRKHHPYLSSFNLHSPGGDAYEALKIGRLFREYLIETWAPIELGGTSVIVGLDLPLKNICEGAGCICASACALIWFGGVDRRGLVGLHRPRSADTAGFAKLSAIDAATVYRELLDEIRSYLTEMEAPSSVVESMISTGSAEIVWVEADSLDPQGISRAPSFAEWTDAACGSFPIQEHVTLLTLGINSREGGLSDQEFTLFETLTEKQRKKLDCESRLVNVNRSRLPAP